jgi:hypothetical protein
MVLKFKVWRLQWEKRGPKGNREILVLRDKKGRIRRCAKTGEDQALIRKWYERYNIAERLESLLATRKLKEHIRRVKQRVRKRGFTFQISFYGIWVDPTTGKRGYRRYEVFKAEKWRPDEVAFLHDFLRTHVPQSKAGVFIFHDNKLMVEPTDELTQFDRFSSGKSVSVNGYS